MNPVYTFAGNLLRYYHRLPACHYMVLFTAMLLSVSALPQCISPSMVFCRPHAHQRA